MTFGYHRTLTMQVGACPARAYYLVGRPHFLKRWKFAYFDDEPTESEALSVSPQREIAVPSCWQMLGYGNHQYTNLRYPFPYDPPYIDRNNPCGVYVTSFTRPQKEGRYYLNFDGVDSCFYVYVNGVFAGYSSVPHCHSEFDITGLLNEENELRVIVFQFCPGSYLEDQDKLRMSGIFRDVYILHRPEGHVFDYTLSSFYDVATGEGSLKVCADAPCKFTFYSGSAARPESKDEAREMQFTLPVRPWSAEDPVLYTLVIERAGERIAEKVGFRTVKAEGNVFTLNGSPVKFRGVNRHSMTKRGYVETISDLKKDLLLIKGMNANAIRTSHYPPHPMLPRLCDEMGIYLLEEADIESHGTCAKRNFENGGEYLNELAKDPRFRDQIVGRTLRMYERDKNRPSVLIWSLGNESGWGDNFVASATALKEKRDGRLLHYEGAWSNVRSVYQDGGLLDLYSRMYPEQSWFEEFAKTADKPVIMCEYTHAMGNSCGDISDYWKIIDRYPALCGGFIWEWCDHSVIKGNKRLYGGDFKEYPHDGNFCMDGIVTTDRIPEPEYYHIKAVYGKERDPLPPALPVFASAKLGWKAEKGLPASLVIGGKELLRRPAFVSVWRAPLDNDANIKSEWLGYGLDRAYFFPHEVSENGAAGKIVTPYLEPIGDMDISCYEEDGLCVGIGVKLAEHVKSLPRFGLVFDLTVTDGRVLWYGRGPGQAYCDKTLGSPIGVYELPAREMNFMYPKPQESGSRCDTRCVGLDFGGDALLLAESETPFSFCVSPYLAEDFRPHAHEMKDTGHLYLYIDYKMSGVGSNSCGPRLAEKYLLTEREFSFAFRLRAVKRR